MLNSERFLTVNVSSSNIKAAVETFLRSVKLLKDSDEVKDITFTGLDTNVSIPVKITIKEEEVEFIRIK